MAAGVGVRHGAVPPALLSSVEEAGFKLTDRGGTAAERLETAEVLRFADNDPQGAEGVCGPLPAVLRGLASVLAAREVFPRSVEPSQCVLAVGVADQEVEWWADAIVRHSQIGAAGADAGAESGVAAVVVCIAGEAQLVVEGSCIELAAGAAASVSGATSIECIRAPKRNSIDAVLVAVFGDFAPAVPQTSKARRQRAKKQKKAAAAAASRERAAAAAKSSQSQAIVPYGCFKSVPIPADLIDEARRTVDPLETPALEREHVRELYDAIAVHWHHTRWKAWPRVTAFIEGLSPGALVADVGCGNGKNLPACNQVGLGIGLDISVELVRICRQRHFEVAAADAMAIPLRSGMFDAALSIAVMHHVSTVPRRLRALAELSRVLSVGGTALVYAWAFEQKGAKSGHQFGSQDVFVPWHARKTEFKAEVNHSNGDDSTTNSDTAAEASMNNAAEDREGVATKSDTTSSDAETIAGSADGKVLQRYCHVYKKGELEWLCSCLPWLAVVDGWYDTGNWAVIFQKHDVMPTNFDYNAAALAGRQDGGHIGDMSGGLL